MVQAAIPGPFQVSGAKPDHAVWGFLISSSTVSIFTGYEVHGQYVRLVAGVQVNANPTQPWRDFWTPRDGAIDAAMALAADAEEYLIDVLNLIPRPVEDLSLDDFIQHLDMRLNNELH